jgi:hypothetical protein
MKITETKQGQNFIDKILVQNKFDVLKALIQTGNIEHSFIIEKMFYASEQIDSGNLVEVFLLLSYLESRILEIVNQTYMINSINNEVLIETVGNFINYIGELPNDIWENVTIKKSLNTYDGENLINAYQKILRQKQ